MIMMMSVVGKTEVMAQYGAGLSLLSFVVQV